MTRIVLVRHASTDWSGTRFCGRTDLPLNETGRAEVDLLVARLVAAGLSVTAVRSSPALRAVETARPLAAALGAPLELDERLREADFGRVEGRAFDDVARSWPDVARLILACDGTVDWPGGERAADLMERCRSVAGGLEAAPGDALVVTHGGPMRVLAALLGIEPRRAAVAPGQLVTLERGAEWRVAELPEDAGSRA